jgi:RHS repeat-associated protein
VRTLDYFPFGAQRINTGTASTKRQWIGQFLDESNLQYLNARYYNPNQGQFLSEDPIFLLLGTPEAEKKANRSLQDILRDPQGLNSYSYARNNPINVKDPSGLIDSKTATVLGLYAQVLNLLSQIIVQMGGGGSAGNAAPASTAMLAHSTTINPQPLNITQNNQRYYGNVINQVQKSTDFKNYVTDKVSGAKNGVINIPATDSNSFTFNQGDLKTALHNVDAGLSGKQSSDGSWNIRVNIQDTYNFEPHSDYGNSNSSKAINTLNNAAVVGQAAGVISPYPVNINFDYVYQPQ